MKSAAQLAQALHGYRNGHRLITSSVALSAADKRFLSVVTDSPDVGRVPASEGLLSGYRLPSGAWFALSMTWSAGPDSRTGAVWTHSLLLDEAALDVSDRLDLLGVFSRPTESSDPGQYAEPVELPVDRAAVVSGYSEWAAEVSWVLHEPPTRPVEIVTNESSAKRQSLLLALWYELWPSLRGTFSFAETPTTRKTGFDAPLDLQLMQRPQGAADEDVRVVSGSLSRRPPEWAQALADLQRGAEPSLHDFLDQYGPDANDPRSAISALAEIWLSLTRVNTSARALAVIELVAGAFPTAADMSRLKEDLLRGTPVAGVGTAIPPFDALVAVLESGASSFGGATIGDIVRENVATVTSEQLRSVFRVASRSRTEVTEPIIDVAVDSFERDPTEWIRDSPDLVARLARLRPEVATTFSSWEAVDPSALWLAVRGVRQQGMRRGIVAAMLLARADVPESEVIEAWPVGAEAVLSTLSNESVDTEVARRWLASLPSDLLDKWAEGLIESDQVRFASFVEALPIEVISHLPADEVVSLVGQPATGPAPLMSIFLAFVNEELQQGALITTRCFDRLYPLAVAGTLEAAQEGLDGVDVDVPSWDPALRLARLLNRGFKQHGWSLEPLFELSAESFRAVIAADSKAGLARRLADTRFKPNDWQARALADALASRADRDGIRQTIESLFSRINPF